LIPRKRSIPGIAGEGLVFSAVPAVLTAILLAAGLTGWGVFAAVVTVSVALFFRDPEREIRAEAGFILSPADGTIVSVDVRPEDRYLGGDALRICIFMSVFNVHINRVPADCEVLEVRHHSGSFKMAHLEEASVVNERTEILMADSQGRRSLMVQIAGLVARRIICRLEPGDKLKTGDRFGLIRFGSRVDIHLSANTRPAVKVGDKVRGGLTVLGELN
jgi:phosphatidylserine decarboxylase